MVLLYSPDGRQLRKCEQSEVDALLQSGAWVRAAGVDVVFQDGDDGSPVEVHRHLIALDTPPLANPLRLFNEDRADKVGGGRVAR